MSKVSVETKVLGIDLSKGAVSVLYRTLITTTLTKTVTVSQTRFVTAYVATAVTKIYTHPLTATTVVVPTTFTLTVVE